MDSVEDFKASIEALREERDQLLDSLAEDARVAGFDEFRYDVDDLLVEYRYDRVEQAVDEVVDLLASVDLDGMTEVAGLRLPGDAAVDRAPLPTMPVLLEALLSVLPEWPESEATQQEMDDYHDLRERVIRTRTDECADHIRSLAGYLDDVVQPLMLERARAGHEALVDAEFDAISAEFRSAYELWLWCLNAQYEDQPGTLGEVGDLIELGARSVRAAAVG